MLGVFNLAVALILVAVGVYMTFLTRFMPFRVSLVLRGARRTLSGGGRRDGASAYGSFAAALGGSIGIGNIAGVAGAIAIGGPGALFWLWVSGAVGMALKYAEILLALKYVRREGKAHVGGTMYSIISGMGRKFMPLAVAFSAFALISSLTGGNIVQSNTIACAVEEAALTLFPEYGASAVRTAAGVASALLLMLALRRGTDGICRASAALVPPMGIIYSLAAVAVLWIYRERLPAALAAVFSGAFGLRAAAGGVAGFTVIRAMGVGLTRGIFSNEAGVGTAPMAYASAASDNDAERSTLGILEVFIDTLLICTLTGLALLCSGTVIPYGDASASGMAMMADVFGAIFPGAGAEIFLALCAALFAFTAMLGWCIYGERSALFLMGKRGAALYRFLFPFFAVAGAVMDVSSAWAAAEAANSLMAIPNIVMLLALSGAVAKEVRNYLKSRRGYGTMSAISK